MATIPPTMSVRDTTTRRRPWRYYWPLAFAAALYGLDQLTKLWAEQNFGPYGSGKEAEILNGLVRFRYVRNTGASFGLLRDAPWLFAGLAGVVAVAIVAWYVAVGTDNRWYQLCVAFILAGAVSNMSDRLTKDGAVTDIINIPWLPMFLNFNLADASISAGVVILLLSTLFQTMHERRTQTSGSHDTP